MVSNRGKLLVGVASTPVTDQLAAAIAAAQGGDVLAPVDVVVPSGVAGVTLRRASAGPRGWANVRFGSLPQLAERLCARPLALDPGPLHRPLAPGDRSAAVRQVLAAATGRGHLLLAARRQSATADLLAGVFAELDDVDLPDPPEGAISPRGQEVLNLYHRYGQQVTHLLTPRQLLARAARAVTTGQAPATHIVLMAAGSFTPAEKQLLTLLRDAGRLTVVVPTVPSPDTTAWLGLDEVADPLTAVTRLVVAPDAEEEVRLAVRSALDHLADTACRPDRIGIAYVSPVPYNRLLAEQLTVAGLPHHVPSTRTLAQTIAGRAVHGLLALDVRGLPRADVLRWMAEGPLLDRHGHRLPCARWERLSRDAGVSRGVETWVDRLDRYAERQRAEAIRRPEKSSRYDAHALDAEALREEVSDLHAAADAVLTASTWTEVANSTLALLRRTLGSRRAVDRWSAGLEGAEATSVGLEQAAYDAVQTLLASLRDTAGPVTPGAILTTLTEGLSAAVPSGTTLGRGVLVGSLRSFDGADLDLLLVLGCTEDSLPGQQRESTVLRDADRAVLSAELATVTTRRAAARQRWEAVLTSAQAVHLSYPRADSRAQRRQFAAPWFLEQATLLAAPDDGGPVTGAQVDTGELKAPWFRSYASFEQSLQEATTYASAHELDVAVALHGGVDRLALTDRRLARGLDAARSRGVGAFDAWSGRTGELPASVRADVDAHLSASTLQTWATCPASHLFGAVLGVRELEDRAGEDTIDARDKGNLVHGVLEKLLRPHLRTDSTLGISPDTAWGRDDLARAVEILEADAKDLEEKGLTGREVLWTAQLARLRRSLARLLAHDSTLRRDRQSTPVAVEAAFGRDGAAHLVVDLPSQGPVSFAGFIDRIDATASGGLVVVDYKTGSGYGYDTIPKHTQPKPDADLLDRGRKLQLLLYALAARQLQGLPDAAVQAWFWFVEKGDLHRGGPITEAQERRLVTVLGTVVGGIRGGVYPANPGQETWRSGAQTWENCSYCAFDRVCPTTRGEQWAGHRSDADVLPYAALVDPVRTTP